MLAFPTPFGASYAQARTKRAPEATSGHEQMGQSRDLAPIGAGVHRTETPDRDLAMRADLTSMLMPFFPEDGGHNAFMAVVGGHKVTMHVEGDHTHVATSSDRKVLNFLAATLARAIRSGQEPSRHIEVETKLLIDALRADGVSGGAEYGRVIERMNRLMATIIETEAPLGDGVARRRRFRWIDAYEHDDRETAGGRKILAMRVSLSEDAFHILTRSLGYDIAAEDFRAITATRSSSWRIYEICFALLARSRQGMTTIPLADLRNRVPISSELKVFKSRTLRTAFRAIEASPRMSAHIAVDLVRVRDGAYEPIEFSARAPLDEIHVRIRRGTGPLPRMSVLIPAAPTRETQPAEDSKRRRFGMP